jgi:hypothetical protein
MHCIKQLLPGALPAKLAEPWPQSLPGHGGSGYVVTDGRRPNAFCDIEVPHQLHYHCKGSPKRCSKQFVNAVAVMKTARDALIKFLHFPQEHWR